MSDKALTPFSALAISGNTHLMQDFICMYTHIIEIYAQISTIIHILYTIIHIHITYVYVYVFEKRKSTNGWFWKKSMGYVFFLHTILLLNLKTLNLVSQHFRQNI